MIKIGDYVQMKDSCKNESWYIKGKFEILNISQSVGSGLTIWLNTDKKYISDKGCICIWDGYVESVKEVRFKKIKKIFD